MLSDATNALITFSERAKKKHIKQQKEIKKIMRCHLT